MSRCSIFLFLLTPCLLAGCGQTPAPSQGNVAVVDLDEVANQLGLGQQWSAELSTKQSSVNQQLAGFQQKLNEQLQLKHSEVVSANGSASILPADQKVQLATYQQELNEKLRLAQTQAKQHLSEERSKIIQNYRQQVERISSEVALHKGFDIVLTKNDSVVLTYTPGADITQEVTKRLKAIIETGELKP